MLKALGLAYEMQSNQVWWFVTSAGKFELIKQGLTVIAR
jgi:hypothetical protein